VCSLSQVLEKDSIPARYFLSRRRAPGYSAEQRTANGSCRPYCARRWNVWR
jgi:hypothetical protein